MFLKEIVVAIGKVRAVVAAAGFFACQRRSGDERRERMKVAQFKIRASCVILLRSCNHSAEPGRARVAVSVAR